MYLQDILAIPLDAFKKRIIRQISSCFFCERLDFVMPRMISTDKPLISLLFFIPSASLIIWVEILSQSVKAVIIFKDEQGCTNSVLAGAYKTGSSNSAVINVGMPVISSIFLIIRLPPY